ncbi:hypothetical protein D9613_010034 [Agrocybe pediades]|uniref:F-box domain-containing protein n=1 Tax=Agrocybe pediades TaxID=84607 RepID=A0A8H4VQD6_9AGAR|nr:hypothetical protein D9613_010034 [Agrocybe pediades]
MGQTLSTQNSLWALRVPYLVAYGFIYHRYKITYTLSRTRTRGQQRRSLDSLPNELLLHIFSFLELKPYLISHGVCKKWQMLLPHAEIHPIRRRMLYFYHHMQQTPQFLETRPWILQNLRPFDRQGYIDELLAQYPAIPEAFHLWILEWPEKMAMLGLWPGLPMLENGSEWLEMPFGTNWIAYNAPLLCALVYDKGRADSKENLTPALLVWRAPDANWWLLFDEKEPELFGRVICIAIPDSPSFYPTMTDSSDYDADSFEDETHPDWIAYLEHQWDLILAISLCTDKKCYYRRPSEVPLPVAYRFSSVNCEVLPSPPWIQRHDPQYQADIAGYVVNVN